ncbi:hypothetical protein VTN96DRAFT_8089 [Rasamsonia emersonii]
MAEDAPPASSAPANGAGTTATATATTTATTTGGTSSGTTTATTTTTTTDQNQNRGLPYYEKLRRDLRDSLQKKRMMDKSMAQLEEQIYRFEQSYLEETSAGNIIKGFDNYIKGASAGSNVGAGGLSMAGSGGAATRRKAQVSDQDRVFSRSSASFMRDSPAPSSAQTTPSHAPTPTSSHNNGTASAGLSSTKSGDGKAGPASSKNKKKSSGGGSAAARDGSNKEEDADGADGAAGEGPKPPTKRLKISYGRD